MKTINAALLGFGTVGNGVYQTIHTHQDRLQKLTGSRVRISTIVIEHPEVHTHVNTTTDINAVIKNPNIDIVFEAIVGKEPAFTYLKQCIKAGKHVITANKEMFASHGKELKSLAKQYHVSVGYDATTAGGIPIIQTIQQLLQANNIQKVQGILNGTSNYILTEMREQNAAFTVALKQAQNLGYAELDPTNDIEGFDAFYKLMILSDLIFDEQPLLEEVKRVGITQITSSEVSGLHSRGKKIKHIATLKKTKGRLTASIEPVIVTEDHPLYAIEGADNAISIEADIVGQLTLTGPGAGALPTASAMIEDFCTIFAQKYKNKSTVIV